MLAAARGLRCIQREVGVADHRICAGATGVANGDSDRCADRHLVALNRVRPRDLLDEGAGKGLQQADVDGAGKDGLELVAAEAADLSMVAHYGFQPVRHLPEQGIADRVAERIVDVLEAIEVDHEERATLLPMRRITQGLIERLAHHCPIREAGERVEPCESADLLL